MKLKIISFATIVAMAFCLANKVSAFPDVGWTGLGNDGMWNNPNNWTNLDNDTQSLPESNPQDPAVQIDQANGWSQVTIPSGYTVDLDYENPTAYYNTIYGGEFGMNLNIKGTLEYGWMMAPVQTDPTPANRGYVNLYNGSVLQTQGAGLGIGEGWWWYQAAPYITANMYGNAQMYVPNIGLAGHLNVYDSAVVDLSVNVFTGNPLTNGMGNGASVCCSDGTASLNLGGGTLLLPPGYSTNAFAGNNVYQLIARGVLRVYGKGYDSNDLIISDNVVSLTNNAISNCIVTPVPLGGSLQRVYFQPLLHTNVQVGVFQQAELVGDYPSVSGVLLSSSEPGLDPASFTHPVYSSSSPGVATVDTNGMVTAVSPGTSRITATVGAFTSTNGVTINVAASTAVLIHRYSFASDASDSVGGANGTLNGDATITGGQLVLSGNQGSSVTLPSGILANLDEISVEAWVSFPSTINPYANLCAFGFSDTIPLDTYIGDGGNYITFSPHTGPGTAQANFGQGLPGFNGERDAVQGGTVYDGLTNLMIAIVYHPLAGYEAFYTNGVLCASISMFNNLIDPVACVGPTFNGQSILAYTIGTDETNFIGESLYTGDPGLLANIKEFRIYSGGLTQAQIQTDYASGPSVLPTPQVSLVPNGKNVLISWPVSGSSGFNLMESTSLGPTASWSAVGQTPTVVGGYYQVSIPISGTTEFFRLSH